MPNYQTNPTWQQQNFQNFNQPPQMPFQNQFQPQTQMQHQSPVMSIAPVRGFENMLQFPVAVGTDLYLLDLEAMKLYRKNNPANPREFEEFDLSRVVKSENQNEPVSRAEVDELKSMMAQMMALIQEQPRQNQKFNGKRGGRHDGSGNVPANDG
ncbi:MAG: hypothetical protein IKS75_06740 [Clostridiales bacterium]|nr:hypothetical protein [Clostridiales bacterium]